MSFFFHDNRITLANATPYQPVVLSPQADRLDFQGSREGYGVIAVTSHGTGLCDPFATIKGTQKQE